MVRAVVEMRGLAAESERMASLVRQYLPLVLQRAGAETLAHLRSLTAEMRPPAKRGEGLRRAHPGRWADVTGQLAAAYAWAVTPTTDGGVTLALSNAMEYAEHLERRDGFFVLSGITDPGGFVEQKIVATWAAVKPIIDKRALRPSP